MSFFTPSFPCLPHRPFFIYPLFVFPYLSLYLFSYLFTLSLFISFLRTSHFFLLYHLYPSFTPSFLHHKCFPLSFCFYDLSLPLSLPHLPSLSRLSTVLWLVFCNPLPVIPATSTSWRQQRVGHTSGVVYRGEQRPTPVLDHTCLQHAGVMRYRIYSRFTDTLFIFTAINKGEWVCSVWFRMILHSLWVYGCISRELHGLGVSYILQRLEIYDFSFYAVQCT